MAQITTAYSQNTCSSERALTNTNSSINGKDWVPDPQNLYRVGKYDNSLIWVGARAQINASIHKLHMRKTTQPQPESRESILAKPLHFRQSNAKCRPGNFSIASA